MTSGVLFNPQKYISHHLNHLQIDLKTFKIINPENISLKHFWILNIDSMFFSVLLGCIFLVLFYIVSKNMTLYVPSKLQSGIELIVNFINDNVQ